MLLSLLHMRAIAWRARPSDRVDVELRAIMARMTQGDGLNEAPRIPGPPPQVKPGTLCFHTVSTPDGSTLRVADSHTRTDLCSHSTKVAKGSTAYIVVSVHVSLVGTVARMLLAALSLLGVGATHSCAYTNVAFLLPWRRGGNAQCCESRATERLWGDRSTNQLSAV